MMYYEPLDRKSGEPIGAPPPLIVGTLKAAYGHDMFVEVEEVPEDMEDLLAQVSASEKESADGANTVDESLSA